jgi:hypothetical protein
MNNSNKIQYVDVSKKNFFRNSAISRIVLGTLSTTSICLFYSLAHAKYRNFPFSFVKNWLRGSFSFSLLFYTQNEALVSICNYFNVYTNFWVNYTLIAYTLSKVHYRYLIRNNQMKWYLAIKYSHKCFLYLLVFNLMIELGIMLNKEIYLYNEPDLFDIVNEKFKDKNGNPNFNMTYDDLEENFMKPFQLFNSREKINIVNKNMKTHDFGTNVGRGIETKSEVWGTTKNNEQRKKNVLASGFKIRTVDFYDLYKKNKI